MTRRSGGERWNPWRELGRYPEVLLVFAPIPRPGVYFPDEQAIVVDSRQGRAMRRSAVTEELAHHTLDHRPHPDPIETARLELRARRWALERLIPIEELADALVAWLSLAEVAEALEVDEEMVQQRIDGLDPSARRLLRRRLGRRELSL